MAVIEYKKLDAYLKATKDRSFDKQVWLVYGEELLHKNAFENLLKALEHGRQGNVEAFENDVDEMGEIIECLNTYSLLSGPKIVVLKDSRLFYTRKDKTDLLQKVKEAHAAGNLPRAARFIARMMGLLETTMDDLYEIPDQSRPTDLPLEETWFRESVQYCRDNNITASAGQDAQSVLLDALAKGIPEGNFLLIATEHVNRGHRLFKKIAEVGNVVDCSVPKGTRAADQRAQESVMKDQLESILGPVEKAISAEAYTLLKEMTGFELRTFSNNLEKLVDFIGDRDRIEAEDVHSVLERSKKDPIYAFTNAVTDRDAAAALFFLESLLSGGEIDHPLQLLAAIIKQVRTLLVVKDFTESSRGAAWQTNLTYNQFRSRVVPVLEDYDRDLTGEINAWHAQLASGSSSAGKKSGGKKSKHTDLRLLKNPRSPYPAFQTFRKSERFTRSELINILAEIGRADHLLKSSGGEGRTILQRLVLLICEQADSGGTN